MVFLLIAAIVAALILGISAYTYWTCFRTQGDRYINPYTPIEGSQYKAVENEIYSCTRIMEKSPCQWVSVKSHDGLTLRARYYHNADGAPLMMLFHGYRSMALRDSAGGFILANKLGMNVLAVDQRAHGTSEGKVISFGIKEREDVLTWVNFANAHYGNHPIVVSGLSMGAATVLMAAQLQLPENVVGIIADSPFSSPKDIIRKVCRDRKLPDALCYPFIRLGARLFGGFSLEAYSAEEAIKHTSLPILLIHGDDDRYVPMEMSKIIYAARPENTELDLFPGAGHGLCYMVDPLRYETVNARFLWRLPALKKHMEANSFAKEHR